MLAPFRESPGTVRKVPLLYSVRLQSSSTRTCLVFRMLKANAKLVKAPSWPLPCHDILIKTLTGGPYAQF